MIKSITFDCWNTLLVDDERLHNRIRDRFHIVLNQNGFSFSEEEMDRIFRKEVESFMKYSYEQKKTKGSLERTETILKHAGAQIPYSEIRNIADYSNHVAQEFPPPVVPGAREIVTHLSKKYKLAVICNTGWHSGRTVKHLLDVSGLTPYFSHLTFSDEMGFSKPHEKIFEYTLQKLGSGADEAVHIGDSEKLDIQGAHQANMLAILFTGANDRHKDDNTADFSIDTYDDFEGILESL